MKKDIIEATCLVASETEQDRVDADKRDVDVKPAIDGKNTNIYQREYIFPNGSESSNSKHVNASAFQRALLDVIAMQGESIEDMMTERWKKLSFDELFRNTGLRNESVSPSQGIQQERKENKKMLHNPHEEGIESNVPVSHVAKALYNVRKADRACKKTSTKSFLYTMLARQYVFRHRDVKRDEMRGIYEGIRQSAIRTDALQNQMNNHVTSLNRPSEHQTCRDHIDEMWDFKDNGYELPQKAFPTESVTKCLSDIVDESIAKLEYVRKCFS